MEKKITYIVALNMALESLPTDFNAEARAKLEALKASQERKNNADRKPTVKEEQTSNRRNEILEILRANGEPMCISDIKEASKTFADMNPQQVSGIIRPLLTNGIVKREEIKRKAYFSIA